MERILSFFSFEILVRPSTILAIFSPNTDFIFSILYSESSTTSCNSAAAILLASKPIFSATILATDIG